MLVRSITLGCLRDLQVTPPRTTIFHDSLPSLKNTIYARRLARSRPLGSSRSLMVRSPYGTPPRPLVRLGTLGLTPRDPACNLCINTSAFPQPLASGNIPLSHWPAAISCGETKRARMSMLQLGTRISVAMLSTRYRERTSCRQLHRIL